VNPRRSPAHVSSIRAFARPAELDGRRSIFSTPPAVVLLSTRTSDGSSRKNPAVISRHKINVFRPEDALDFQVLHGSNLCLRGRTGAYAETPSIAAEKEPAAIIVHFASTFSFCRLRPRSGTFTPDRFCSVAGKIIQRCCVRCIEDRIVSARLSTEHSSGRRTAASTSSLKAGSSSRASSTQRLGLQPRP